MFNIGDAVKVRKGVLDEIGLTLFSNNYNNAKKSRLAEQVFVIASRKKDFVSTNTIRYYVESNDFFHRTEFFFYSHEIEGVKGQMSLPFKFKK